MIVLDTTVLIYAVGSDHGLREPCRALLGAVGAGRLRASTTPEVIQEFVHVRARRRSKADAAELGRSYAEALAPLLVVEPPDLIDGLELYERSAGLGPFDAVLAAVARRRDADALASADRAFAAVDGLTVLDPGARDFAQRLATLPPGS